MIFTIFRPKRIKNGKPCVARSYRGRYRLDGQARIQDVALYTADKRVARQRLEDIIRDKQLEATGTLPPERTRAAAKSTLAQHLEALLADLRAIGCDSQHLRNVKSRNERLFTECGWQRVSDVTAVSFEKWRAAQTIAPNTLNGYLKAARTLLNWMTKRELIERNPLRAVALIKTNGKQTRPRRAFTHAELARLLGAAGTYRPAYVTAVYTGLRRGELAALEWNDVVLDALNPHIKARAAITKNGKDATIALHPDVVAELRALQASRSDEAGRLVFHKLLPSMKVFRRHLKIAEIQQADARGHKVDFHALRHTLATNLNLAGVAPRVAMEVMRHCDIRLTMQTYTDVSQLPAAAAVEKLPSFGTSPEAASQGASQNVPPASPDKPPADHENAHSNESQNTQNERIEWSFPTSDRTSPENAPKGGNRPSRLCGQRASGLLSLFPRQARCPPSAQAGTPAFPPQPSFQKNRPVFNHAWYKVTHSLPFSPIGKNAAHHGPRALPGPDATARGFPAP